MKKTIRWLGIIWAVILGAKIIAEIILLSNNGFMIIIPFWIRYILFIIIHAIMVSKIGYKKSINVIIISFLAFTSYSFCINSLSAIKYNNNIIDEIKPSIIESLRYYLIPSIAGTIFSPLLCPKEK